MNTLINLSYGQLAAIVFIAIIVFFVVVFLGIGHAIKTGQKYKDENTKLYNDYKNLKT